MTRLCRFARDLGHDRFARSHLSVPRREQTTDRALMRVLVLMRWLVLMPVLVRMLVLMPGRDCRDVPDRIRLPVPGTAKQSGRRPSMRGFPTSRASSWTPHFCRATRTPVIMHQIVSGRAPVGAMTRDDTYAPNQNQASIITGHGASIQSSLVGIIG